MVDEPMVSTRPNDADAAVRSTSQYEVEWRDGLSRLMSNLEGELQRAVDTARRQASDAIIGIERQGLDLLTKLDERRQEADAEHAAVEERVATVQANIKAAEQELVESRATAQREATDIVNTARHRADTIVSEAEARSTEILADADEKMKAADAEKAAADETLAAARHRSDEITAEAEERQRESEAEQRAIEEQIASIQASIESAEAELRQERADAESEAAEMVADARREADAIVARAESRAAEIIADARANAATRSGSIRAERAAAAAAGASGEGRLRGLSERVGMLLPTPGGRNAGAASEATEVKAAASASPASSPVESDEPDPTARPAAPVQAYEDASPTLVAPATPPPVPASASTPNVAPPPDLPGPWSRGAEADDVDEHESAATQPISIGSAWASDPVAHDDDDEKAEQAAAPSAHADSEPVFVRRNPQATEDDDADDVRAEAAQPATPPTPAPVPPPPAEAEPAATGPAAAVTQTLIFQSVPNFQAALALERSLKAMSEVREVRVADFDERQLTFQVTHELGAQLPRVLLTQRGGELEFVEARPERVEFVFRS
jgi:hypothetical protein